MPRLTLIEGGGEGPVERLLSDDFLRLVSGEPRRGESAPSLPFASGLVQGGIGPSPDPALDAFCSRLDLVLRRMEALTDRLEDTDGQPA